jgi:hypothetical protein
MPFEQSRTGCLPVVEPALDRVQSEMLTFE